MTDGSDSPVDIIVPFFHFLARRFCSCEAHKFHFEMSQSKKFKTPPKSPLSKSADHGPFAMPSSADVASFTPIKLRSINPTLLQELSARRFTNMILGLAPVLVAAVTNVLAPACQHVKPDMSAIDHALFELVRLAAAIGYSLVDVIRAKIAVNCQKYRVEWCKLYKNKALPKYTANSNETGIYSDRDTSIHANCHRNWDTYNTCLERFFVARTSIANQIYQFAVDRNRLRDYTRESVSSSLYSEYGELTTVLQWNNKRLPVSDLNERDLDALLCEIADVSVYLFHAHRFLKNKTSSDDEDVVPVHLRF